jgi:hypothetical protein
MITVKFVSMGNENNLEVDGKIRTKGIIIILDDQL